MDLGLSFSERLARNTDQGEMRDGAIRYLMIRPDGLMGLFARLDPAGRAAALAALAASVAEFGGRSVKAYRAAGAVDPDALMGTIVRTSADLGWGRWRFAGQPSGAIEVRVENSPFAQGARASGLADCPCCAPIVGMLTALAPLLAGEGAAARETACAAQTEASACLFEIGT